MSIYFHEYAMVIVSCVVVLGAIILASWLTTQYSKYSVTFISGITGVYVEDIKGDASDIDMSEY